MPPFHGWFSFRGLTVLADFRCRAVIGFLKTIPSPRGVRGGVVSYSRSRPGSYLPSRAVSYV